MPAIKGPLDDIERPGRLLPRLLDILIDKVGQPLHERMRQTILDGAGAPFVVFDDRLSLLFHRFGKGHQPFRRIRPAVQQHVLDQRQQILGNFLIDGQLARIDDAHVEACLNGVVQKRGMHRFTHHIVAAEREGDIADSAADLGQRQVLLDPPRRFNEIDRIVVMLLESRRDGQDVRIENNVLWRDTDLLREQAV